MNDIAFLIKQTIELQSLLNAASGNPVLEPQLKSRLASAQHLLNEARKSSGSLLPVEVSELPRVALFMRGGGIADLNGNAGIRPSLAAAALSQYEKMFIAQVVHNERIQAQAAGRQRRPKGSQLPEILFVGTPQGSFGLEFTARENTTEPLSSHHSTALADLSTTIATIVNGSDESIEGLIKDMPTGVLAPLKGFLKTLSSYDTDLRIASNRFGEFSFGNAVLKNAAERLEQRVTQTSEFVSGVFRGFTRETGHFDLKTVDEVISGYVSDEMTEEDFDRLSGFDNRQCEASIRKTIIATITGQSASYVLLALHEPNVETTVSRLPS